ncbi:hypothetical protein GCM10007973_19080 [Polymorphobacter multimanifer]|uniref:Uncharacterized protein (DUF1330 family) n=1 Tax=Polymorphobacter multimanifer TaxID=1070431 RepID=A0A841L7V5_9SPHN|nr:DUF1330 domain-containing protein [Polymorphobacter multimanifer]MBB6228520.1 uncharacterized protein (DUF1330 family) [Polymorphobacter multimanifer]GGI82806.1 hypothetical protein GCM10007973_19080 [Polymorphobacter multimanifer]
MPAFLLVIARVHDPARMKAYADALAASGLYPRHGGAYAFIGKASTGLENWDMGQSIVCARFPSLAAAQAFWHDAQYQDEIKPLRLGAADVQVAIFEGPG